MYRRFWEVWRDDESFGKCLKYFQVMKWNYLMTVSFRIESAYFHFPINNRQLRAQQRWLIENHFLWIRVTFQNLEKYKSRRLDKTVRILNNIWTSILVETIRKEMLCKTFVVLTVVSTLCLVNGGKVTLEQLEQANGAVRLMCLQKSKVSEDILVEAKAGKLSDTREFKCYVNCVVETMQMVRKFPRWLRSRKMTNFRFQMKKGKILYEACVKNIETLMPDEITEGALKAINVCKDVSHPVAATKDYCEAAAVTLKCLMNQDPSFSSYFPFWCKRTSITCIESYLKKI